MKEELVNLGLPNDRRFLLGFLDNFGAVRDTFEAEKLLPPLSEREKCLFQAWFIC